MYIIHKIQLRPTRCIHATRSVFVISICSRQIFYKDFVRASTQREGTRLLGLSLRNLYIVLRYIYTEYTDKSYTHSRMK